MRVAFYAPMKPPCHPVPSGDRRMARALMGLLADLGHEVVLASRFRSYDGTGDPVRQARLSGLGAALAARLTARLRRRPPDLWFTYHLYHKAPDWLGPRVSRALAIPYVVAEASLAAKRATGAWAIGYAGSRTAIMAADLVLAMTGHDLSGLRAVVARDRLRLFPPFLDAAPFRPSDRRLRADPPLILVVAMMRRDAKLASYQLLAAALALVNRIAWRLALVGDGEARLEVEQLFAPFGERVSFLGQVDGDRLPALYAAADLYVWPACNEAYGMALLEAQAAGLPVIAGREGGVPDIVADGESGILVAPRAPGELATAIGWLLTDPERREAMGMAARNRVLARHDLAPARERLAAALAAAGSTACVSA